MDINKILSLNIPDIHPTYGGVRGKTMSSRSQGYAWPIIREASTLLVLWDCIARILPSAPIGFSMVLTGG